MRKVSRKQSRINRELEKVRRRLSPFCVLCGMPAAAGAHLLPRSLYPEYYTEEWNLVPMCERHHYLYDNDISFRQQCHELYDRIKAHDERAADKYFRL